MILKLAYRNLLRNRWRTGLSVAGVALAVAMLVWTLAYMEGFTSELIRGATSLDLGQIQIHNSEYVDKPQIRHALDWDPELLTRLESDPSVVAATPRVRAFGIVGHESRSVVTSIVGVDPEREPRVSLVKKGLKSGRWFSPAPAEDGPRETILGVSLARQLGVDVGDELVLLLEAADGSMGNDLLMVIGLVETKNQVVDRRSVFLSIEDLQYIAALEGQVHEVSVTLTDVLKSQEVADRIVPTLAEPMRARAWQELIPEISQMVDMTTKSDLVMYFMVYLIVAFGLFNSQRMSALERTREFGVIRALGVTPAQLALTVLLETIVLSMVGAVIGAGMGFSLGLYHQVYGLDLSMFSEQASFEMMGVSFSGKMDVLVTPRAVYRPIVFLMPVAILCGLYPAWVASRLDITRSISGRT